MTKFQMESQLDSENCGKHKTISEETNFQDTSTCMKRTLAHLSGSSNSSDTCILGDFVNSIRQTVKRMCSGCNDSTRASELNRMADIACSALESKSSIVQKEEPSLEVASSSKSSTSCKGLPVDDVTSEECHKRHNIPCNSELPKIPEVARIPDQMDLEVGTPDVISSSNAMEFAESLSKEFTCPICQEILYNAQTLECNHTFCEVCIDSWLHKSHSCPLCRKTVLRRPKRSRGLDKAVEQCASLKGRAYCAQRNEVYTSHMNEEIAKEKDLEEKLRYSLKAGAKFVNILQPWSPREQARFFCGLKMYGTGRVRQTYCGTVNLTDSFIRGASQFQLAVAAANLNIKEHEEMTMIEIRNRLFMFVKYS